MHLFPRSPRTFWLIFTLTFTALLVSSPGWTISKYEHLRSPRDTGTTSTSSSPSSGETSFKPNSTAATYPISVSSEMRAAFKVANDLYENRNWTAATGQFEQYLKKFSYNALSDAALYRLAEITDAQHQPEMSRSYLSQLIAKTPDAQWRERARFLLGRSFFEGSEYQNAYMTLAQVRSTYLESWQKIHYYSLLIRLDEKRKSRDALYPYYFLRLSDAYTAHSGTLPGSNLPWIVSQKDSDAFLSRWTRSEESMTQLPSEISQYAGGPAQAYSLFHVGYNYNRSGDTRAAYHYLKALVDRFPDHPNSTQARVFLDKIGNLAPNVKYSDGIQIGVILPLSGPYAQFGHAVLRGIRCASGDEVRCSDTSIFSLVVRDTEGEPELAKHIFSEFEKNDDISLAFGPMSSKASIALAPELDDHNDFALLSVAQGTLGQRFPNFFQATLTPETQVRHLVDEAMAKGLTNIGIFYPSNSYGQEMASLFERELTARGGKAVAKAGYRPDTGNAQDVSDAIRSLKAGVTYFGTGGASGFQALFIPDAQARTQKIARLLAADNISNIPLIGTNAWNGAPFAPDFVQLFPNSFFTDLFYTQDPRAETASFVKRFTQAFGHAPNALEALGYDLIRFANQAIQDSGKSRKSIKKALHNLKNYTGATALSGFSNNGEAITQVYILSPRDRGWARVK